MKTIEIPYRQDDPKSVDLDLVPAALLKAIDTAKNENPELIDCQIKLPNDQPLDRLFERLYNCRIEYNEFNGVGRVIWPDDKDYIWFLMRWA